MSIYVVIALFSALAFGLALLGTFFCIPIAKGYARRWNLVDLPDDKRKLHHEPIPLIGGLTIFAGVSAAIAITTIVFWSIQPELNYETNPDEPGVETIVAGVDPSVENDGENDPAAVNPGWNQMQLTGLLLASLVILLVGLLDDRFSIRGRQKLAGQILAATILIVFGFSFQNVSGFGQLGIFAVIAVYGWMLIGINSVNLLDGADGFAATIGILTSAALCVMATYLQQFENAILTAAMVGALLAFMRYNFPPASAYLGDAGSMLIGLFLSAMAIRCASKSLTAVALLAPMALLAIPLFDTFVAIVRRQLTGRSIYTVDRGHLHHALIRKGFSPRKALLLFFAMCLMTATGGTLSLIHTQMHYAVASILAVVIFLVVGRVFGFAELKLITNKSKAILRSFFVFPHHRNSALNVSVRLQGERDWELCWQILREFAEKSCLQKLTMDLNLPWLHESFHAKYQRPDRAGAPEEQWAAELPLRVEGRIIGRVDLIGNVADGSFYETVSVLEDVLNSLEPYFLQTMKQHEEFGTDPAVTRANDPEFSGQAESTTTESRHALDVG